MIAILKIAVFIIAVCLVLWVVWANTQPIPEEPCDLNECDTCSFQCEQHEKKMAACDGLPAVRRSYGKNKEKV